jgi:hypothetical protein
MIEKLKFIASGAWTFLRPIILVFISQAGPILIQAATRAVAAAASMPASATNSQRRDMAFNMIAGEVASKGISVGTAVINACLEAAVVKLKSA